MKRLRLITYVLPLLAIFLAAFAAKGEEAVRITQIDTSQFPRVTFYVSVTDANGDPLAVDSGRFVITENGQEISPDQIAGVGEVGSISTVLVMDVSGSMEVEGKLDSAMAAAHEFVSRMRSQDQAGLISFNTQTEVVQGLTSDKEALDDAIDSLVADDDTAMYDALMVAIDQLEGVEGRKAIILLTDGLDNSSSANINNVTNAIGPEGISISTAGLGVPGGGNMTGIDEPGLQDLAGRAGGVYGYAEDQQSLTNLYENYADALQSEYAITYTSPASLRDGVNRSLGVSLAPVGGGEPVVNQDSRYNPGGLVPEVEQPASWPFFAAVVIGLAALVLAPILLTNRSGSAETTGGKKGSSSARVKTKPRPRITLK